MAGPLELQTVGVCGPAITGGPSRIRLFLELCGSKGKRNICHRISADDRWCPTLGTSAVCRAVATDRADNTGDEQGR